MATNQNPSKLRGQDNKALIQQPEPTVLHPSILKGSHPQSLPYFPGVELAESSRPESYVACQEAQTLATYGLAHDRCGLSH